MGHETGSGSGRVSSGLESEVEESARCYTHVRPRRRQARIVYITPRTLLLLRSDSILKDPSIITTDHPPPQPNKNPTNHPTRKTNNAPPNPPPHYHQRHPPPLIPRPLLTRTGTPRRHRPLQARRRRLALRPRRHRPSHLRRPAARPARPVPVLPLRHPRHRHRCRWGVYYLRLLLERFGGEC
jgi:hypothetical protein